MQHLEAQLLSFIINEDITLVGEGWGNPENPSVIFLHGGGQTRHSWGDTAKVIAEKGWYAVAYDARGHGDSSWSPTADYKSDFLANDLRTILKQLNQKPALVGASMGGITSLIAEGESAESISSALVLVDIAPKVEQKGVERIFAFMSGNLDGFDSLEEAAEAVAAYLPHRPKPTEYDRLMKNLRVKEDGKFYWHWDPKILQNWKNATPEDRIKGAARLMQCAKSLKIPTMIVRGGMSDVVSEQVMDEFLEAVPHVKAVEVSNAGHMIAGDSNHSFTNAVIQFLEEVYPASKNL